MQPTAAATTATLFLLLLLVAAGCGDESAPHRGAGPAAHAPPDLPPIEDAAKARFALDRLLRGPLPRTGAFSIPKIHQLNLQHARADLVALGQETIALLSDPEWIAKLTRPDGDRNPWHNVLLVLTWMDPLPVDLAERWCRPVLAVNDLQLDRRAVQALLAVEDGQAIAPLLVELLERRATDRELAPTALRALVRLGDPWRAKAVDVAFREGTGLLWSRVPASLETATEDAGSATDALAWWALLADASGPALARGTSRNIPTPWFEGRLLLDDAVWPRDPLRLAAAIRHGRILLPAAVEDAAGFLPLSAAASRVLAWRQVLVSGRPSAADARCRLAQADHAAFRRTVERDLAGGDPMLALTAEQCPTRGVDPAEVLETARIVLAQFLEDVESGVVPSSTGVPLAFVQVLDATEAEGVQAAVRILRHARPQGTYRALIEMAHDALARADDGVLVREVATLLRSEDGEDRATGLLLVRRGRDFRHAAVLDELLAKASRADAALLERLLIWLHTAPQHVDEEARKAFAKRYASWVESAPDAEAQGLASGMLDLGAAGAEAYAAGLAGARRPVFVKGLLGRTGLVPVVVAEALLAPVDAATSPAERRAVLVAAYRSAPTAAAPFVAALRGRIAEGDRAEVDDVLAVVRHRAHR